METSASFEARSAPWPYPASEPLGKASKQNNDDIKTGVHLGPGSSMAGDLLTGHAVSGAEGA